MRVLRLSICAALIPLLCLAAPVSAGTYGPNVLFFSSSDEDEGPQNGNTLSHAVGLEIEKVTFTTSGVFTKAQPRARYTPKNLVIKIEVSAPIQSNGLTLFNVDATIAGCPGYFRAWARPGDPYPRINPATSPARCTELEEGTAATYAVTGNTITFTIPLSSKVGLSAGSLVRGIQVTASVDGYATKRPADVAKTKESFIIG